MVKIFTLNSSAYFKSMDPLKSFKRLVTCKKCKDFIDRPIRLPCHTICSKHVNELREKKGKCDLCSKTHEIPDGGFEIDEELNKIITNDEHLNEEEKLSDENIKTKVEKLFEKFEFLKKNSDRLKTSISYKLAHIKQSIDSEVERLKQGIEDVKEKLFKQIDSYQDKCNEVIQNVKLSEKENMITNEKKSWQVKVKFSKEIETKQKFESNLDSLISRIEADLYDVTNIEDSLEKVAYISNEVNLNTFYKSDQFLGDLSIPEIELKTEDKQTGMNDIESKFIKVFYLFFKY